ncbi:MAG: hypothetical protein MJK04_36675 [Psychrosphaera sp.]|nr:hypothetical protein [Psychrosphaera sp.]
MITGMLEPFKGKPENLLVLKQNSQVDLNVFPVVPDVDNTCAQWTGDLISGPTHYLHFEREGMKSTMVITLPADSDTAKWQFLEIDNVISIKSAFRSKSADGSGDGKGGDFFFQYDIVLSHDKKNMFVVIDGEKQSLQEDVLVNRKNVMKILKQGANQSQAIKDFEKQIKADIERLKEYKKGTLLFELLTFSLAAKDSVSGKTSLSDPSVGIGITRDTTGG